MSTSSSVAEFSHVPIPSVIRFSPVPILQKQSKESEIAIEMTFSNNHGRRMFQKHSPTTVVKATAQMCVCCVTDRHSGDYLILTLSFNVLWSHIHCTLSLLTFPTPDDSSFLSDSPNKVVNFDYQMDCIQKCPGEQRTLDVPVRTSPETARFQTLRNNEQINPLIDS